MENEQISVILENEGLSASQLAERLGVQRSMISHLQSGRNRVSLDLMKKIHHSFPHISLQWLMDQEGDYYEEGVAPLVSTPKQPSSEMKSLFDDESINNPSGLKVEKGTENEKIPASGEDVVDFSTEKRDKMAVSTPKEVVCQSIPTKEKPTRKIVEIVVFYDDGTYENYLSRPKAY